jgi:hypothetical protein
MTMATTMVAEDDDNEVDCDDVRSVKVEDDGDGVTRDGQRSGR